MGQCLKKYNKSELLGKGPRAWTSQACAGLVAGEVDAAGGVWPCLRPSSFPVGPGTTHIYMGKTNFALSPTTGRMIAQEFQV